jgi:hypothetical protein
MAKTNAAKVQELIGLAMKVQETTEYCVFIQFSGHVNNLEIDISKSKKNYKDRVIESEFRTDGPYVTKEHFERRYKEIKGFLVNILKKGKIDYEHDSVWKEERVEYDYKF